MFIHTYALNEMNVIRQGDITGFDDAEVIDVEDTEDEEVDNSHTETKAKKINLLLYHGICYNIRAISPIIGNVVAE